MRTERPVFRNPWTWVPTLYYTEGLPYVVVMTVSVIMYKRLGISNTELALYTSWLYLPWVIKPFWSPLVDMLRTKRLWIWAMQLLLGGALAGVALTIPTSAFFQYTLAFFWLMAFSSATHDIAADGFYMLALDQNKQAFFVGIRSTFYRLSMITGQGLIVILAGYLESSSGLPPVEWTVVATPNETQQAPWTAPDSLNIPTLGEQEGLLISTTRLSLAVSPLERAQADSLLAAAKAWNLRQGFYAEEKPAAKAGDPAPRVSWWQAFVADPLAALLKKYVGKEVQTTGTGLSGKLGWVGLRLTAAPPPGETLVVNLAQVRGDKSISLVEGSRLTFDANNWNQPAMAVFRLDPKLKTESLATYRATSGNLPLAWSLTFGVLAALLVIFFAWHRFVLPYPEADRPAASGDLVKEFFKTFLLFFQKKKRNEMKRNRPNCLEK